MSPPSQLVFLYGTETGTSEEFAFMVANIAVSNGINVVILPIDEYPIEKWGTGATDETFSAPLIFFISTAGQGEMPMTMTKTWETLRMSDAPDLTCRYAVFGLGDSTYSKFNYAAKMFHNRLQQLGGTPIVHRGLGDERDGKGIAQELNPWLDSLWPALGFIGDRFIGFKERGNTTTMSSMLTSASVTLSLEEEQHIPNDDRGSVIASNFLSRSRYSVFDNCVTPATHHTRTVSESDTCNDKTGENSADHSEVRRDGCWALKVKSNTRLTSLDHFQHVSYITFEKELSDIDSRLGCVTNTVAYQPGDCLALYPTNSGTQVSRLLRCLHISESDASSKFVIVKPNASFGILQQPSHSFMEKPILLKELLTRFIDLEGTVSQAFLRMFAHCAVAIRDGELVDRMRDLGTPANSEDYNSFAYREKRTMIEVMEDFPRVPVSLEALLSNAPLMRPRYYSISSSPTMDVDHIGLTVALFQITTPLGRERKGLCSRWLCEVAEEGSCIEGKIFHRPFQIHPNAPLVLIGPGAGVAPLRSLIRERIALAENALPKGDVCQSNHGKPPAEMILFFGCRNQKGDYLHGSEWEELCSTSVAKWQTSPLKVVTAFSRDAHLGTKKEYVQHKLIDDSNAATKVFRLLFVNTDAELHGGGGVVIICGNAKHMPTSVQDALASILAAGKGISKDEALTEINRLRVRGRIKYETWSV